MSIPQKAFSCCPRMIQAKVKVNQEKSWLASLNLPRIVHIVNKAAVSETASCSIRVFLIASPGDSTYKNTSFLSSRNLDRLERKEETCAKGYSRDSYAKRVQRNNKKQLGIQSLREIENEQHFINRKREGWEKKFHYSSVSPFQLRLLHKRQ